VVRSAKPNPTVWEPHPDFATVIAGEIKDFDPEEFMTKKMARRWGWLRHSQVVSLDWLHGVTWTTLAGID
jgi:hypothetical protein